MLYSAVVPHFSCPTMKKSGIGDATSSVSGHSHRARDVAAGAGVRAGALLGLSGAVAGALMEAHRDPAAPSRYSRSTSIAMPMPPATHIDSMP